MKIIAACKERGELVEHKAKRKRILLLFGYYLYKIHIGIVRYAKNANWIVYSPRSRSLHEFSDFILDGVITFSSFPHEFKEYLADFDGPIVQLAEIDRSLINPRGGFVFLDNHAIGRMAAEYFISRGLENIVFVKRRNSNIVEDKRIAGFIERSAESNFKVNVIALDDFPELLPKLPRPMGVLTENDYLALNTMNIIEEAGLHIPLDVALLGVDNDELCCELSSVSLSSIDTNLEGRGYEAASLLDHLVDNPDAPPQTLQVEPLGVVTRQSTDIINSSNPHLSKALNYIFHHFKENITPDDVADIGGICRRRLDDIFHKKLGCSISMEIYRQRMQLAKKQLLHSDEKLAVIAAQCGFSSTHQFISRFKQDAGITPGIFRQQKNNYIIR